MKKYLFLAVLLFFSINHCWSQIGFEKGYFINESEEKVSCLIRNRDWNKNPTEFEYRLTENEPVQTASIRTVKEFGLPGSFTYIRATVEIDMSGDLTSEISSVREPLFQEETVFLKVLVDGDAQLFVYSEKNKTRFFYKSNGSEIEQLIYKRYVDGISRVSVNSDFRHQLFSNFQDKGITVADIQKVDYQQKDMEHLFMKLNGDTGGVEKDNMGRRDVFNLSLRAGVNFHNLLIEHQNFEAVYTDFGSDMNFRLGVEFEYILPFNRNKWGLIAEPTYRYYFPEAPAKDRYISKVNLKAIDVSAGIRHYFFLNDKSKIFINGCFGYDFTENSDLTLYWKNDGRKFKSWQVITTTYLAAGVGFKYNNRYSMEVRYNTGRDILTLHKQWYSSYKTCFVTVGYSLF